MIHDSFLLLKVDHGKVHLAVVCLSYRPEDDATASSMPGPYDSRSNLFHFKLLLIHSSSFSLFDFNQMKEEEIRKFEDEKRDLMAFVTAVAPVWMAFDESECDPRSPLESDSLS